MTQESEIKRLLEKFLEGQTTEREEQVLMRYFNSSAQIPARWQAYQTLFQSFDTDAYDFSEKEIDAMLAPVSTPNKPLRLWIRVAVAAAVVGVVAFAALLLAHHSPESSFSTISSVSPKSVAREKTNVLFTAKAEPHTSCPMPQAKPKMAVPHNAISSENLAKSAPKQEADITTSELVETIQMLTALDADSSDIIITPHKDGFVVCTLLEDQTQNTCLLKRCPDGTSLELSKRFTDI